MEHLNDKEMLELLGAPATDRPQPQQEHLSACDSCRQRFEPLEQTWDELGTWSVSTRGRDLTQRILSQITQIPCIKLWETRSLMRVAASIIIGLAAGYWAADHSSTSPAPSPDSSTADASSHLEVLGLESATGWSDSFLYASGEGR